MNTLSIFVHETFSTNSFQNESVYTYEDIGLASQVFGASRLVIQELFSAVQNRVRPPNNTRKSYFCTESFRYIT